MRTCTKCNKEKSFDEFHFKETEARYHSWCKSCVYELQKARWIDKKRKAMELFGSKCSICGYDKCLGAMEFHHIDPNAKDANWNKLRLRSWDKIVKELKKCQLLCCRCHREIHYENNELKDSGKSNIMLNYEINFFS